MNRKPEFVTDVELAFGLGFLTGAIVCLMFALS